MPYANLNRDNAVEVNDGLDSIVIVKDLGDIPGEVMNPADLTVACAEGSVRLTELQPEGSKRMSAQDYLRGHPVKKGEIILPE